MALRGAGRMTADDDLLIRDVRVLDADFWKPHTPVIHIGDDADVFHGVLRFNESGPEQVDVIVPKYVWMDEVLAHATDVLYDSQQIRVATACDIVLLKLFAAGLRDRTDIQLMLSVSGAKLVHEVDERIAQLDEEAQALWTEIKISFHA